jgi:hypothetical protein
MYATEVFREQFVDRTPQNRSNLLSYFIFLRWTVGLATRKYLETG